MTTIGETPVPALPPQSRRTNALRCIVGWMLLSALTLATSLVCYALLDLSLGTIFAVTILAAIMGVGSGTLVQSAKEIAIGAILIGLSAAMPILLAGYGKPQFAGMWFQLLILCGSMAGASLATTSFFKRWMGDSMATTLSLILSMLWLTWPVWLSPWFDTTFGIWAVDHLLTWQPLIALNGVFAAMGDWSHAPIAYKWLTNLGQDAPFALPAHAWPSIVFHLSVTGLFGAMQIVATKLGTRQRPSQV